VKEGDLSVDFIGWIVKIKKGILYKGKSGCYIFICLEATPSKVMGRLRSPGDYYIGSAVCFYTRFKSHKINSVRPDRGGYNALYTSVRELGWDRFV